MLLTDYTRPREDGYVFSNALQLVSSGSGDQFGATSAPFGGFSEGLLHLVSNETPSRIDSDVRLFSSLECAVS